MRRALALAALLALGTAGAQLPEPAAGPAMDTALLVAVAPAEGALAPRGAYDVRPIEVRYRYLEAYPEEDPTAIRVGATSEVPWILATVAPDVMLAPEAFPPCGCEREVVLQSYLLTSATQDAPAFRPARVVVRAEAPAHGAYKAAQAEAEATATSGYAAIVEATTPTSIFHASPDQRLTVPITVTNFANGASRIAFSLGEPLPSGLAATLPAPSTLGARQQGHANLRTYDVRIGTAAAFEAGHVMVQVEASSVEDDSWPRDRTLVAILVMPTLGARTTGGLLERGAPAESAVAAVAVLAALALAARRW